jgi:hypothetical protein
MFEFLCCALIPLVWARAPTRRTAGGAVWLLYLLAAREQPLAIVRVLPQCAPPVALALWLAHGAFLALPWLVTWSPVRQPTTRRALGFLAALLWGLVPPWGLLGWLHPLTLSGWLFPAWRWAGLAATAALLLSLGLGAGRSVRPLTLAALIANALYRPLPHAPDWVALETQLPRMASDALSRMNRQAVLMARVTRQLPTAPSVLLLPEEIAGPWTAAEDFWWQPVFAAARARGTTLVIGAQRPDATGLRNGALIVTPTETRWQLARQPIPLAEWNPLGTMSAPSGWFAGTSGLNTGITPLHGERVMFSFCYEDLLVLPQLVSAGLGFSNLGTDPDLGSVPKLLNPKVLVSMANLWWAEGMEEPEVQRWMVTGWGRLWGIPVVRAVNGPA